MAKLTALLVVGARPNYMKIAPLYRLLSADPSFHLVLVHTGQHFDEKMSQIFFDELHMPKPDVYLGVGSNTHAVQTAHVMIGFEPVVQQCNPDWIVVVGDVNSTLACALVASKRCVPLAHVESGLRSHDRTMPEEINRILTDRISDLLLTPSPDADENLRQEGASPEKIHLVGNIMIDSLRQYEAAADQTGILGKLGLEAKRFALVTLHRPSNVDDPASLGAIVETLGELQQSIPVVFPVHPRTRKMLAEHGYESKLAAMKNLILIEPLGYLEFLKMEKSAAVVITDSGGIQEETTVLGVPCLTIRENTERPITITEGTNILVGRSPRRLLEECRNILDGKIKRGRIPDKWDGHTAERIAALLKSEHPGRQ